MKKAVVFIGILAILVSFRIALAEGQVLEKPKYRNGDWWKVAIDFDQGTSSRSSCYERYPEYMVKIVKQKRKLFVNNGEEEIRCPAIVQRLLGSTKGRLHIPFPLKLNESKKFDSEREPFESVTVTLVGTKTHTLGSRHLEVYEIKRVSEARTNSSVNTETLLFNKECKCNVVFIRTRKTEYNTEVQKLFLKDFGVKP